VLGVKIEMKYTVQKCKYCNNNIKIDVIDFPIDNDFGGIIIECGKCNNNSFLNIKNPSEAHVSKGGNKVEYWDHDITTDKEILDKYENIQRLEKGILVGEINKRNLTYNLECHKHPSLFWLWRKHRKSYL
jgi:hypothetical protein